MAGQKQHHGCQTANAWLERYTELDEGPDEVGIAPSEVSSVVYERRAVYASWSEPPLTPFATALRQRRFLLVWAGAPFLPDERPPRNPALAISRWQEEALALPPSPFDFFHGRPWPLVHLPPLPILSLDPSERLESAFRYAGVPLHTVRTRRDLPRPDRYNLFKLGGDLATRAERPGQSPPVAGGWKPGRGRGGADRGALSHSGL